MAGSSILPPPPPSTLTLPDTTLFEAMPTSVQQPMLWLLQGQEGSGKTHVAFSAPGPIGYINLDGGNWKRVRDKFKDKDIRICEIVMPAIPDGATAEHTESLFQPVWSRVKQAWQYSLATCVTTVMDSATTAWAVARLAYLGRLSKVKSQYYDEVNADFEHMVKMADNYPSHAILVHHEKPEYNEDGRKTGSFERAGYSYIGRPVRDFYRCQLDLANGDPRFVATCLLSKTRPQTTGKSYIQPNNSFADIAMDLYPNSDIAYWLS